MKHSEVIQHIVNWLREYSDIAGMKGFIVGVSGGVDSALVAHLCARTGKKVLLLNMPILQHTAEYERANALISSVKQLFPHVDSLEVDLTDNFKSLSQTFDKNIADNQLVMANTRARLRMLTLYAYGQQNGLLVTGTGNKVEDFGIGFFTKYGDGGVDISPIGDLMKTDVYRLAKEVGVIQAILEASPTDGLWEEEKRTDEAQIGATYPELEWAMEFEGSETGLDSRQKEVLDIYRRLHRVNGHKFRPIPVCKMNDKDGEGDNNGI